jgi:hypothetical protein
MRFLSDFHSIFIRYELVEGGWQTRQKASDYWKKEERENSCAWSRKKEERENSCLSPLSSSV